MPPSAPLRHVGVALALPEPTTGQLQGWRERLGDPGARDIPPHVTLLPPTPLPATDLPAVEAHLRWVSTRHVPWTMRLSGAGSFRPVSPVVFVVVHRGAPECDRLAADVRAGPLDRELAFPYHPHVTVAHDLGPRELDAAQRALRDYEATFTVWGFTLFERARDGAWWPQRDFPFGPTPVGPALPPDLLLGSLTAREST